MELLESIIHSLGMIFFWLGAALMCIRRLILNHYNYPHKAPLYFGWWFDGGSLREIAEKENSKRKRIIFKWINILIPTLIICGSFLLIYTNHFI